MKASCGAGAPARDRTFATPLPALGESNKAFAWLEKAYEERDPQSTYIKAGRRFEPLRKDPRFEQLVRR